MDACAKCGEPFAKGERTRTFVWSGYAIDLDAPQKPDLRVHERCLADFTPPDPYYRDASEPFLDSGM